MTAEAMNLDRWIARWEGEGGAVPQVVSARKRSSREQTNVITLRTILVPIDFSPESLKTLRYARLLGRRFSATLRLVHVVNLPRRFQPPAAMLPRAASEELARSTKEHLQHLKILAAEFSLPPRPNPGIVRFGAPAEEISDVARETQSDLIVIATRGYTGLKHAFLGSTTERVVRTAACPVLVVREKEKHAAGKRPRRAQMAVQFRKILVPVDFSSASRLGVDYALGFAQEFRASVVLFHSVFVPVYVLGHEYTAREVSKLIADQEQYAGAEMEKLAREVSGKGPKVKTQVAFGSPVEQISDYVKKENVDLIITSTHGRSGLQRLIIGSTAEHIVRHAACPVLVVPNRLARKKANKRLRLVANK